MYQLAMTEGLETLQEQELELEQELEKGLTICMTSSRTCEV